jgi:hypothetical protein
MVPLPPAKSRESPTSRPWKYLCQRGRSCRQINNQSAPKDRTGGIVMKDAGLQSLSTLPYAKAARSEELLPAIARRYKQKLRAFSDPSSTPRLGAQASGQKGTSADPRYGYDEKMIATWWLDTVGAIAALPRTTCKILHQYDYRRRSISGSTQGSLGRGAGSLRSGPVAIAASCPWR